MGKNTNPARTDRTRTQVVLRTEPNRTEPQGTRTRTEATASVARIKNCGWPKMHEWSEWPIKHLWFNLYSSRIKGFKLSVFNKLSIVLYSVHWYMYYVHIQKLSLRGAVVTNRSITASMLGVSDRWICSIIRHSRHFSSIEALNPV